MINLYKRIIKIIFLGGLCIILAFCTLLILYKIGARVEANYCFEKVGNNLNVAATYDAISQTIFNRVQAVLIPGIDHDQVEINIKQIAPASFMRGGAIENGGFVENVRLETCYFPENDIFFLIYYTKDRKFQEIRLMNDD
jgi:hypothetical protein